MYIYIYTLAIKKNIYIYIYACVHPQAYTHQKLAIFGLSTADLNIGRRTWIVVGLLPEDRKIDS